MRIAIVGAGVIGMTTAVAVKSAFPLDEVNVVSEKFSPYTTADGSAGLWGPYILGGTPHKKILRWAGETHRWLESLWKAGLAEKAGISLLPTYRLTKDAQGYPKPLWLSPVYGPYKLSAEQLTKLSKEHNLNYTGGWHFLTYTCEPMRLLPWLTNKFITIGGKLEERKVQKLQDLIDEGYDLIINCSGLGSRQLVGDEKVIAVRGQIARVNAPWLTQVYLIEDDDGHYIVPNMDSTILGGTRQANDNDMSVRKGDSKHIFKGCYQLIPALQSAQVINEWVGLRPGRPEVRVEPEILRAPDGQKVAIIHNYGHGGSGVTLSWGCALEVVELMKSLKTCNVNSKL